MFPGINVGQSRNNSFDDFGINKGVEKLLGRKIMGGKLAKNGCCLVYFEDPR